MLSETVTGIDESLSIDPEASFSFSDDEEDMLFDRKGLSDVPNNTSFRLKIRKGDAQMVTLKKDGVKESILMENSVSISRINSFPVTQREKLNGRARSRDTGKMDAKNELKFHRGNYYDSKSWRSQNVYGRATHIPGGNPKKEVPVTEQKEQSYFESILSLCSFFLSAQEDDREIKPSTSSFEGVRQPTEDCMTEKIADKDFKTHFQKCVDAINSENYDLVLNLIETVPGLITFQSSRHQKKNLLHIIGSIDKSIPLALITNATKFINGLQQTDRHGCIPLHYAASVGRNLELVKWMICEWKDGTMVANTDGDLPLHVAVWSGMGYVL